MEGVGKAGLGGDILNGQVGARKQHGSPIETPNLCGANPGSPVTPDYEGPFRFTGTLHSVTVDLSGERISDDEAERRLHMARQ